MKNIKYSILALGTLGLGLASCSDSFLDVESATESNSATFYKTESDAYRALIGCYDGWRCTVSNQGMAFYLASEIMSDECFGGTGNGDGYNARAVDRFDLKYSPSDLNIYESEWKNYYAGVYRCNELINKDANITWKGKHGLYMGQAHALRAFLYFDMVRLWGNIPLITEATNESVPQAPAADVYKLIVEDLKYAADSIPADAYPKKDIATNDGWITRYAAQAMLARVYLFYTGYYGSEPEGCTKAEALAAVEGVITSQEYDLVPDFKDLWPAASSVSTTSNDPYGWDAKLTTYVGTLAGDYAANKNTESVLTMKFNNTQDYNGNNDGNRWLVMMGIRNFSSSPYGQGWGACTVPASVFNAYKYGDTRRNASIIDLKTEGITAMKGFDKSIADQREYTGYTVKKYTPMAFFDGTSATKADGTGDFQTSQFEDFMIIRYADVLLMAAELGSPNAQDYFDQVRERAYGTAFTSVPVTADNIMEERKLEFAFEGIRYWDVLRQGIDKAAQILSLSNAPVLSGGVDDVVTVEASRIKETKGLSQIPNNQITLSNGVLQQNAGW